MWNGFWRYRYLLWNLVSRDFKLKYRRSVLGVVWSVLNPLLMCLVYWAVFSSLMDMRGSGIDNFAVFLMCGQLLFNFFNEATSTSMSSVLSAAPLLKKVYIPKYIFPLEKCCFAMVNCVFSFVALLLVMIFTGAPFHLTILEALYPLVTLFFFSLGVGLFLAAATVFFRDIMHIWSVFTTATSNGSVNAMHDSLNPLSGLMPMIGMWLNVVFGGVGVGFINMFLYIIVGVFISGMMVGRTPEYLGRKVETREMKLALLAILAHPLLILGGTALFAATPWGADTVANPGFHGFSEILYEFTSSAANNGSGFEGLGDNTVPWNIATGLVMLLARYIPIILPLAMAGSLAAKKAAPETAGTLRTDNLLFGGMLLGCVLIVGALLFMPVAVLGPIAEHLSAVR